MYCYENGLNPLLPQYSAAELRQQPAYNSAEIRYSGYGERTDDSTYHAIETDKGVVLFDGTQHGESLQQKYIDFHVKNYFDERLDITFLKKIDVIPDAGQLAKETRVWMRYIPIDLFRWNVTCLRILQPA